MPAMWAPDVDAAAAYAGTRNGPVAFAVRAQCGEGRVRAWGRDQDRVAVSASVLKAMLLVAYLERGEVRLRALRRDERALLDPMVRRSDDVAATRVLALIGERRLERAARRWGMERFHVRRPWGHSTITAREQVRFWLHLDARLPPRHRAYGLRLLRDIVPSQRWGVARVAPAGWALRFKGGWGSGSGAVDHQVALLTRGRARVSLAVLTTAQGSHAHGKETLRGIAARLLRRVAARRVCPRAA
jgi:hypothetical protein